MADTTENDLDAKIAKLPAWARDYIRSLQRQTDLAMRQYATFAEGDAGSSLFVQLLDATKGGLILERPINAMSVGCRSGNVVVFMHPGSELTPGVKIRFDHASDFAGGCAILTEASNCIQIIEIPRKDRG